MLKYKARYYFRAPDEDMLSFFEGDMAKSFNYARDTSDWLRGTLRGREGMFPITFCSITWDSAETGLTQLGGIIELLKSQSFSHELLAKMEFLYGILDIHQQQYGDKGQQKLRNELIWPELLGDRTTESPCPYPTTPFPPFPYHILQLVLIHSDPYRLLIYQRVSREWFTMVHSNPMWEVWGRNWNVMDAKISEPTKSQIGQIQTTNTQSTTNQSTSAHSTITQNELQLASYHCAVYRIMFKLMGALCSKKGTISPNAKQKLETQKQIEHFRLCNKQ